MFLSTTTKHGLHTILRYLSLERFLSQNVEVPDYELAYIMGIWEWRNVWSVEDYYYSNCCWKFSVLYYYILYLIFSQTVFMLLSFRNYEFDLITRKTYIFTQISPYTVILFWLAIWQPLSFWPGSYFSKLDSVRRYSLLFIYMCPCNLHYTQFLKKGSLALWYFEWDFFFLLYFILTCCFYFRILLCLCALLFLT